MTFVHFRAINWGILLRWALYFREGENKNIKTIAAGFAASMILAAGASQAATLQLVDAGVAGGFATGSIPAGSANDLLAPLGLPDPLGGFYGSAIELVGTGKSELNSMAGKRPTRTTSTWPAPSGSRPDFPTVLRPSRSGRLWAPGLPPLRLVVPGRWSTSALM